jgi:hypothetical protein
LEENYRPDVRARPHLPRGRVFTVRGGGKNRVRADAEKKKKKIFFLVVFGKREDFFNFQFSIFKIPKIPKLPKLPKLPELRGLRGRSREKKKVFSA